MSYRGRTRRSVLAAVAAATVTGLGLAPPATADPAAEEPTAAALARAEMAGMSLEEKVGQLFVTYVYGGDANTPDARNTDLYGVATPAEVVDKYHLGGAIYFSWSNPTDDLPQIARLSNGLQEAADADTGIPLLVSTDQEGGIVARMGPPATAFPGNMALGAGGHANDARAAAKVTGKELAAVGVNQNLAPDADVNVNPLNPVIGVRSFSSDPELTARMTRAAVTGYEKHAGISATPKHFPGHGDTETDSHVGLPYIHHTREEWEELDRPPFQAAVDAGVDAIMTAHIVVPALDPNEDPATLSEPIMTGILREEMGYDGVVITDALGMQGVRDKYGDEEVPVRALEAGVDQLLMPPDMDLAYDSVLDAVDSGRISERRIDRSVFRVLRLKYEKGLFGGTYVDPEQVADKVGTPSHQATSDRVTNRSVTAVKNDDGVLPLSAGSRDVLVTGWGQTTTATLGAEFTDRGASTTVEWTGSSPSADRIAEVAAEAGRNDLTVVLTMNASGPQQQLVDELLATGKPVVAVAVRNPYDIADYPDAPTYLATYSYASPAMPALARVLHGEIDPRGKLPVDIPRADDPDQVLYPFGHGLRW